MTSLHSLCVFCGASVGADPGHREAASRLGQLMADAGVSLVFGGGHIGMMGVLADAVLRGGGRVLGVIPEHLVRVEMPQREISELIVVDSMHTRKRRMFDMAQAFCVLPGGLGTLDETFEILTWKQLRLHGKPVIVANLNGYWTPWLKLIEAVVEGGFAHEEVARLFTVVETIEEVLPTVAAELNDAVLGRPQLF